MGGKVTVYIKKFGACPKCDATIRRFQRYGIQPTVKHIEDHMPEALDLVPDARSAPIVHTNKGSWSDLRMDKIDDYATRD